MGKQGSLADAARGYIYQDVATAYLLAIALVGESEKVIVDSKEYAGDILDDLTTVHGAFKVRRQFKSSADLSKTFDDKVFRTTTNDLRIDDVLDCWIRAGNSPADEYRICSTWKESTDPEVSCLLVPAASAGSFEGWSSSCFRLNVEKLWPSGGEFIWRFRRREAGFKSFSRDHLLSFSERLIIELNCPQISLDWEKPGDLEQLLLVYLGERVGVGRYPNDDCRPADIAARLVLRASQARAKQETVIPRNLLYDLGLRSDFGRLPQKFPVVEEEFVERPEFVELKNVIESGCRRIALCGPPGSGKSWLLTECQSLLSQADMIVLRHYCYVDPHDKFRAERVTVDALYANLLASLRDQLPSLKEDFDTKFGASRQDFERLLLAAANEDSKRKVVIIVDGLDHISRVFANNPKLSEQQTSILHELATMPLPENVCLVVGSQPISALGDLGIDTNLQMKKWNSRDGLQLLKRMGFLSRFYKGTRLCSTSLLKSLLSRSDGNPLYLHYLTVQLREHVLDDTLSSVLSEMPVLNGDLNNYYQYLFAGKQPGMLARLFSCVDFSLSEPELAEAFPYMVPEVIAWVKELRPVLSSATAQGGLRIYHDSFRQYVIDECKKLKIGSAEILTPLIAWLRTKGFYEDVRAYNNLLRLLQECGDSKAVLNMVTDSFVVNSLRWLQPEEAIRANLAIAAGIAADERNWSIVTRLSELHRILHSAFEEHLHGAKFYAETFASVHGYAALAQRLLYEGRPRFNATLGLSLCSLCDDNGVTPPWRQYFEIASDSDLEQNSLAAFHGFTRTDSAARVLNSVLKFLLTGRPSRKYLRGILHRLSKVRGRGALLWLAYRLPSANRLLTFEISLAIASTYPRGSNARRFYSNAALYFSNCVEQSSEAVTCGATRIRWAKVKTISELVSSLNSPNHKLDPKFVREFRMSVGVIAQIYPNQLLKNRRRLTADGWYRAWMRYLMDLSLAIELAKTSPRKAERMILLALYELSRFDKPSAGPVRTFDLYPIRLVINQSLVDTFALLRSNRAFNYCFRLLEKMMRSLTGWAWSVPAGPFTLSDIVDSILLAARRARLPSKVLDRISELISKGDSHGYFYQEQAEISMKLTVACAIQGERIRALKHWEAACSFLCGYGQRKDRTIFEIIEGFPACDESTSLQLFERLRPLIDRVDHFTDGRETKYAMVCFFERLCLVNRSSAALLLMATTSQYQNIGWRYRSCLHDLLLQSSSEIHPILGYFALECVEPADGLDDVMKSLVLLERLASCDERLISIAFQRLVNWPSSQHFGDGGAMFSALIDFATRHGIKIPDRLLQTDDLEGLIDQHVPCGQDPIFAVNASVAEMIRALREYSARKYTKRPDETKLANAIFYRAMELLSQGDMHSVGRLIGFFRDNYYLSDKGPVMEGMARGFLRYGYSDLAASIFVNAYMCSRGGRGWLSLGDENHFYLLDSAVSLSIDKSMYELFERMRDLLTRSGYIAGLTQYLITLSQRLAGTQAALACWSEAFSVIQTRLITDQPVPSLFEGKIESGLEWCIDELFIGILFTIDGVSADAFEFIFRDLADKAVRPLKHLYSCPSNFLKVTILTKLLMCTPQSLDVAESLRSELESSAAVGGPLASSAERLLALLC